MLTGLKYLVIWYTCSHYLSSVSTYAHISRYNQLLILQLRIQTEDQISQSKISE